MFNKLSLLILVLFLVACAREEARDYFYPGATQVQFQEQARFQVTLDPKKLQTVSEQEKELWELAREKCIQKCARELIRNEPLVQPGISEDKDQDTWFMRTQGEIPGPRNDKEQDRVQEFECFVSLTPMEYTAGEIQELEGRRSMVASGDMVDLTFYDQYPGDGQGYFFLGRRTEKQEKGMIRIFGAGRVLQILERQDNPGSGVLGKGRILETRHEVLPGDIFFMARMEIRAVPEEVDVLEPDIPEVQVDPEMRITPEDPPEEPLEEPKEMK